MTAKRFATLMSPFTLAGMELRNRVTMAPMSSALATAENRVSARQIAYFRARAAGGCAMITVEFTCVDRRFGLSEERQLVLEDESALPGHKALVQAVHAEGARAALQLQMPGQYANPRFGGPAMPTGPSDVVHPRSGAQLARALSPGEIAEIIASFGRGAALAVAAGYDAIELHAAHGYLIAAFLSPLQNRRTDEWGGDCARRLAFPVAVVKVVRAAIGARPLIYRLSADERAPGGLTIADTAALVPALEAAGVDAFHISSGTQVGALEQIIDPMNFDEGWRLDYADALRAVTRKPLITVGMRWPSSAEAAIAEGRTDLIALGRPLLADPAWANKAGAGREDLVRPCTSCNWCMDRVFRHLPVGCAENPLTGREDLDLLTGKPGAGRRLVVLGAGPGGMATAIHAAHAGFDVDLFERTAQPGGGLIASAAPPFKDKLDWYRNYLIRQLAQPGLRLHLGVEPTPQALRALAPEAVIVATGALSLPPDVEAGEGVALISAYELLSVPEPILPEGPILVYGGGETGCETAELMAAAGRMVHLVTRSDQRDLARAAEPLYRKLLRQRLRANPRITLHDHAHLLELGAGRARIERRLPPGPPVQHQLCITTAIIAQGRQRPDALIDALAAAGLVVHAIGDARQIGRIGDAVHDGHALISRILGTEALVAPA